MEEGSEGAYKGPSWFARWHRRQSRVDPTELFSDVFNREAGCIAVEKGPNRAPRRPMVTLISTEGCSSIEQLFPSGHFGQGSLALVVFFAVVLDEAQVPLPRGEHEALS